MITVTKTFSFDAAHNIPNHLGKCRSLHGHTYSLEITIMRRPDGSIDKESGMVMDFGDLKKIVAPVIEKLDHSFINDTIALPTAENMLEWIAAELRPALPGLCRMRLWETPTSYAEWLS